MRNANRATLACVLLLSFCSLVIAEAPAAKKGGLEVEFSIGFTGGGRYGSSDHG